MRGQRIIRRKIWKLNENQTRVRFEKRVKELETLKKDGSVYEVGYLQLRIKKQPVPCSLLDRVVKRFAYFGICSSSPIIFGVAYFFGGFPQKLFVAFD